MLYLYYNLKFDFKSCIFFQIPRWASFLCGFGLFVYQSLDAIDGKQARRTGSSSPLGELFDHGCDAISTGIFYFSIIWNLNLYFNFLHFIFQCLSHCQLVFL